jgi:hypothetical protein
MGKTSSHSPLIWVAVFGLFMTSSKNLDQKWTGTVENRDGVAIVENAGKPVYENSILRLHEEISIGKAEGAEEYLFSSINGYDVDQEDNVYIIDGSAAQIRVFDRQGRFLRTIGKKGQGPGEFQYPLFIQISNQEEIFIFDVFVNKLQRFSKAGLFINAVLSRVPGINLIKVDSEGRMIGSRGGLEPIGGRELKILNSEGNLLMDIAKAEPDLTKRDIREFDIGKPRLCFSVSRKDHIYWGFPDRYEIKVVDASGKLLKIIRNQSKRIDISVEDKAVFEKNYVVELKRGWKLVFRDQFPFFDDISLDDQERLFVRTYEKAEGSPERFFYDIFNPEGKYLAKIPIAANLNSRSVWKNGKLYTRETDPEGFEKITRYRVEWTDR